MTLAFRNLTVTPDAPVSAWGVEGILAAIDRGELSDWRRVVAAVWAEPDGEVAADLAEALELAEDTGVATALRRSLDRARMSEAERLGAMIAEWVRASGLTQAQFAREIGTSASRLSTYVRGKVVPSAVLAQRMRALGGRREVW